MLATGMAMHACMPAGCAQTVTLAIKKGTLVCGNEIESHFRQRIHSVQCAQWRRQQSANWRITSML
jgi:hypothetical protein